MKTITSLAMILTLVAVSVQARERKDGRKSPTEGIVEKYFEYNNLKPVPLAVGMTVEEFKKALGTPTETYKTQDGLLVEKDEEPKGQCEEWLKWHHNPTGRHGAPIIRARVKDGIVVEIRAHRE